MVIYYTEKFLNYHINSGGTLMRYILLPCGNSFAIQEVGGAKDLRELNRDERLFEIFVGYSVLTFCRTVAAINLWVLLSEAIVDWWKQQSSHCSNNYETQFSVIGINPSPRTLLTFMTLMIPGRACKWKGDGCWKNSWSSIVNSKWV